MINLKPFLTVVKLLGTMILIQNHLHKEKNTQHIDNISLHNISFSTSPTFATSR